MYPQKYQSEAHGHAHHLFKYMEYENVTPALHWFNYAGIAAAGKMDWNEVKNILSQKSETELNAITMMEFDWLDCPDLTQNDALPLTCTEDLSVTSFDAGHKPSGTVADTNDSLAMAQASISGTVDSNTALPSTSKVIQGSSKLVPVDVDANDLASMAVTVYDASVSLSNFSSVSSDLEDPLMIPLRTLLSTTLAPLL